MKYIFEIDFHPPMDKPKAWAFTVRVQEYRQGKPYGGQVVQYHRMLKRTEYRGTMRCARNQLQKMAKYILT